MPWADSRMSPSAMNFPNMRSELYRRNILSHRTPAPISPGPNPGPRTAPVEQGHFALYRSGSTFVFRRTSSYRQNQRNCSNQPSSTNYSTATTEGLRSSLVSSRLLLSALLTTWFQMPIISSVSTSICILKRLKKKDALFFLTTKSLSHQEKNNKMTTIPYHWLGRDLKFRIHLPSQLRHHGILCTKVQDWNCQQKHLKGHIP